MAVRRTTLTSTPGSQPNNYARREQMKKYPLPTSGNQPKETPVTDVTEDRRTLQHVMVSPTTIGDIAKSVLVLVQFEHKMIS